MKSAGAGLLLAGPHVGPRGGRSPPPAPHPRWAASRLSRITSGTTLVHADLHNHTLLSDGDGDPALAYDSMRSAGLDVAALTDHSTLSDHVLGDVLADLLPPEYQQARRAHPRRLGAHEGSTPTRRTLDGAFTAIRGFEWTEPLLGHVNVWFTEHYVDVLQAGVMTPLLEWLRREPGPHPRRRRGRHRRLQPPRSRARPLRGVPLRRAGARPDGVAGDVQPDATTSSSRGTPTAARRRCAPASTRAGGPASPASPTSTAPTGDHPEGKGRTGLWVAEHTRAGVKAAMLARRFFATRTSGLRVDATASFAGGGASRRWARCSGPAAVT